MSRKKGYGSLDDVEMESKEISDSTASPKRSSEDDIVDIYGRPKFRENASFAQLRRVLGFIGPELPLAALATFCGFCGTILSLISPQYAGRFFDAIVDIRTDCIFMNGRGVNVNGVYSSSSDGSSSNSGSSVQCDVEATMDPLVMIVVFSLTGMLISNIGSWVFSLAGRRVIARTRKELFHAYLHQDMFFFDMKGVGELISRIGPDVSQIEGVTTAFASLLNSATQLVGSLVLMFTISGTLSLTTLLAFPVWAATAYVGGNLLARLNFVCNNLLADQSGYATDILAMISTVRAFGQEHRESMIFAAFTDRVYRLAVKIFTTTQSLVAIDALTGLFSRILMLWLGARFVVNQSLTLGVLVAFQTYSSMASSSFNELSALYARLMAMIGGSQVIVALLDSFKLQEKVRMQFPPVIAQQIGVEARGRAKDKLDRLPRENCDIEFRNVFFTYPSRPQQPVLSNFSVTIKANQMTALVGHSGAGKSSILSLLLRYYEPTGGHVFYGSNNLTDFDIKVWRRSLALVTQEPVLLSGTVAENIMYGVENWTMEDVERAAKMAGADEFIARLGHGYDTMLGHLGGGQTLSGGQKQRIAIARAVARNPRILLLDEPTSALDRENEKLITQTVESLRQNRIVIMITHHLDIIRHSDTILVMNKGQITESGNHTQLLEQHGAYWEFYRNTAAMGGEGGGPVGRPSEDS